eukprot:scaffold1345_cov223-Pinguiococcus_pyrenoidosus.AAC.7
MAATTVPSTKPSLSPTFEEIPTAVLQPLEPTSLPTLSPLSNLSDAPWASPSLQPSESPTWRPSASQNEYPSFTPSLKPESGLSDSPTSAPSVEAIVLITTVESPMRSFGQSVVTAEPLLAVGAPEENAVLIYMHEAPLQVIRAADGNASFGYSLEQWGEGAFLAVSAPLAREVCETSRHCHGARKRESGQICACIAERRGNGSVYLYTWSTGSGLYELAGEFIANGSSRLGVDLQVFDESLLLATCETEIVVFDLNSTATDETRLPQQRFSLESFAELGRRRLNRGTEGHGGIAAGDHFAFVGVAVEELGYARVLIPGNASLDLSLLPYALGAEDMGCPIDLAVSADFLAICTDMNSTLVFPYAGLQSAVDFGVPQVISGPCLRVTLQSNMLLILSTDNIMVFRFSTEWTVLGSIADQVDYRAATIQESGTIVASSSSNASGGRLSIYEVRDGDVGTSIPEDGGSPSSGSGAPAGPDKLTIFVVVAAVLFIASLGAYVRFRVAHEEKGVEELTDSNLSKALSDDPFIDYPAKVRQQSQWVNIHRAHLHRRCCKDGDGDDQAHPSNMEHGLPDFLQVSRTVDECKRGCRQDDAPSSLMRRYKRRLLIPQSTHALIWSLSFDSEPLEVKGQPESSETP